MNEDLVFMNEILANNFVNLAKYKSSIDVNFFKTQTLLKSNPHVRAFLLLLAQQKPLDLTNGNTIDINQSLSSFNRKEYHHIFPKHFLSKRKGLKTNDINLIANYCFLPANSNKIISNKAPSDYFVNVVPAGHKAQIFQSNLLPTNDNIYNSDDHPNFINERADIIFTKLKELTGE
jgi:hypothetical protein